MSAEWQDWALLAACCLVGPLTLSVASLARCSPPPAVAAELAPLPEVEEALADEEQQRVERSLTFPLDEAGLREHQPRGPDLPVLRPDRRSPHPLSSRIAAPFQPPANRIIYYDLWRTLCVALVVITHADEDYAQWNVLGVQQWVLPIITLISGSLYARSQQPLLHYNARLLMYFSLGVFLNWAAAASTGVEWHGPHFGDNVLFQVAFVTLFAVGATVAAPLKWQLVPGAAPCLTCLSVALYAAALSLLSLLQLLLWWQFRTSSYDQLLRLSAEVFVTAFLAASLLRLLPEPRRGLAGCVLAAWIYGTRIAHREPRPGSEVHCIDLFIWAFLLQRVPLPRQAWLGETMARAWPAWVVTCALLLPPGVRRRVDQQPFDTAALRLRQYLPELVAAVAFTSIPLAGPDVTLPFTEGLKPHLPWLSRWSLAAFVCHKAVYYVLPPVPYGLALVLVAMPALAFAWGRGGGAAAAEAGRAAHRREERPASP